MNLEPSRPADRVTDLRGVVADVGDRVQEILDAAERVAGDIRADAEARAERYLEERRADADELVGERVGELAELTRTLKTRLEAVQHEAAGLIAELDRTIARMVRVPGQDASVSSDGLRPVPTDDRSTPQPVAYPGTRKASGIPEQALLRATQMAVGGSDRDEIAQVLSSEFGIEDPEAMLDRMLSAGSR